MIPRKMLAWSNIFPRKRVRVSYVKGGSLFAVFSPGAWHECWGADGDPLWAGWERVWGGGLGVVEEVPDLAGDVAFEAADRLAFGFAF